MEEMQAKLAAERAKLDRESKMQAERQ